MLAKSNMAEWAFSPDWSIGSAFGVVRNPYQLDYFTAGSSGGTAAGTALLLVHAAACSTSQHLGSTAGWALPLLAGTCQAVCCQLCAARAAPCESASQPAHWQPMSGMECPDCLWHMWTPRDWGMPQGCYKLATIISPLLRPCVATAEGLSWQTSP